MQGIIPPSEATLSHLTLQLPWEVGIIITSFRAEENEAQRD